MQKGQREEEPISSSCTVRDASVSSASPSSELETGLIKCGVEKGNGPTQAGGLVASCDEKLIIENIERLETLQANGAKVAAGLLIAQTRKGELIRLPEGVKSKSEKEAERKQSESKRAAKLAKEKAAEAKLQAERKAAEERRHTVEAKLAGLSEEDRNEVIRAAMQNASFEKRSHYENCCRMRLEGLAEEARYDIIYDELVGESNIAGSDGQGSE